MKIYCFSGLGADHRVFSNLKLNFEFEVVPWLVPLSYTESFDSYLKRIRTMYFSDEKDVVMIGVSFGGLAAQMMAELIPSSKLILISTAINRKQIPNFYNWIRPFLRFIPYQFLKPPYYLLKYFFGIKTKKASILLNQIIGDTDTRFVKWAIGQLLIWQDLKLDESTVCIHGVNDRVLLDAAHVNYHITNGGHFTIVEECDQISEIINQTLEKFKKGIDH